MTALIVALLVTGSSLLVAEAHLPSFGALGVGGVCALALGAVLAVDASGGSALLALALAVPVALGLATLVLVAGRMALVVRSRRPHHDLVGRVGVVRHVPAPVGDVLVDGELWRARTVWPDPPREGEQVVVEQVHGLTLGVRRAEEWELLP